MTLRGLLAPCRMGAPLSHAGGGRPLRRCSPSRLCLGGAHHLRAPMAPALTSADVCTAWPKIPARRTAPSPQPGTPAWQALLERLKARQESGAFRPGGNLTAGEPGAAGPTGPKESLPARPAGEPGPQGPKGDPSDPGQWESLEKVSLNAAVACFERTFPTELQALKVLFQAGGRPIQARHWVCKAPAMVPRRSVLLPPVL